MVDDGVEMARQLTLLMEERVRLRIFNDYRSLFESIGSTNQVRKKVLRQSIAFLKQVLEDGEVEEYFRIEGNEIMF